MKTLKLQLLAAMLIAGSIVAPTICLNPQQIETIATADRQSVESMLARLQGASHADKDMLQAYQERKRALDEQDAALAEKRKEEAKPEEVVQPETKQPAAGKPTMSKNKKAAIVVAGALCVAGLVYLAKRFGVLDKIAGNSYVKAGLGRLNSVADYVSTSRPGVAIGSCCGFVAGKTLAVANYVATSRPGVAAAGAFGSVAAKFSKAAPTVVPAAPDMFAGLEGAFLG